MKGDREVTTCNTTNNMIVKKTLEQRNRILVNSCLRRTDYIKAQLNRTQQNNSYGIYRDSNMIVNHIIKK